MCTKALRHRPDCDVNIQNYYYYTYQNTPYQRELIYPRKMNKPQKQAYIRTYGTYRRDIHESAVELTSFHKVPFSEKHARS